MVRISRYISRKNLLIATALLIAVSLFFVLRPNHRPKVTVIPSANGNQAQRQAQSFSSNATTDNTVGQTANSSDKTPSSTGGSPNPSASLTAPYGNFVSNHAPPPNEETSICNTTPGAVCHIVFTMGSDIKQLAEQATDSNGTARWDWSITDAGLTAGEWQVSAVAKLNGQTKTTVDQITLKVK